MVLSAGHRAAPAILRLGREYPQVYPRMRFPLAAQGEFWKQMMPDSLAALPTANPTVPALPALAQPTGGAVWISHSRPGIYPFLTVALRLQGIAAFARIEPGDGLAPYNGLPVLVLFGGHMDKSPRWAPRPVNGRAFVAATYKSGDRAELSVLADTDIHGNARMLM